VPSDAPAIRTSYVKRHGPTDGPAMKSASAQSRPEEYAKGGDMRLTIAGTPDSVAAKVQQLAAMGINHLHLRFMGEWDGETRHICKTSAELFAKEVLPRFAEAQPSRQPALATAR
jgi:alkanesulfonate monooxygenase SsuD/methylene tetrahydromethanopterin reductase-like flavin-dependent oxidoreductase (luciferase family)